MSYLVAIAFALILCSLGAALYFMMRGGRSGDDAREKSRNMARALTVRIGLSVLLFVCVLLAWKLGYITPSGLR